MNPHEVLGLEPDERDPAVIKRAYVAALRRHRPDEDPEGFRRVREAYECLLAWGTYEDEEEYDDPAEAAPDIDLVPLAERTSRDEPAAPPEPPREPLTDAPLAERVERDMPSALRAWRAARAQAPGAARTAALRAAARAMADDMRGAPDRVAAWTRELLEEWGDDPAALAAAVRLDDLIAELEGGGIGVTHTVLEFAFERRKFRRLADAAERILASVSPRMEQLAQSGLHAWLAEALALAFPDLARRLVDFAFETAAPDARGVVSDEVDEWLAAGEEIAFWPEEDRLELARLALDGAGDGAKPASRAVARKAESLGDRSLVLAIVRGAAPTLVKPRPSAAAEEPSRGSWVWAIIAIFMVIKWAARCEPDPPPSPTDLRDTLQRTDDLLRRSRDLLDGKEQPRTDDEEMERIRKLIERLEKDGD